MEIILIMIVFIMIWRWWILLDEAGPLGTH